MARHSLTPAGTTVHSSILCACVRKRHAVDFRSAASETSPNALRIGADGSVAISLINMHAKSFLTDIVNLLWPVRIVIPSRPRPVITTEHLPVGAKIVAVYTATVSSILRNRTAARRTRRIRRPNVGRGVCRCRRERSGRGRPRSCILRLSLGDSNECHGHEGRNTEALHRRRVACSKSALGVTKYGPRE